MWQTSDSKMITTRTIRCSNTNKSTMALLLAMMDNKTKIMTTNIRMMGKSNYSLACMPQ
jgi:hypothetical protein